MTEKSKKRLLITSIVILLPMIVGILLWNRLPSEIATHFDNYGEPNGWSSKTFAVFGLPLFLFAVNAAACITMEHDPRRSRYPEKMMKLMYWVPAVVSWIAALSIYGYSLGFKMENTGKYASLFLGLMLIIVGNYMPKVKQNYFLGIKLPWTYADEENWNKTHRFAGRLWVFGGIFMLANYFIGFESAVLWVILVIVLAPSIYSWVYFLKKSKKEGGNE